MMVFMTMDYDMNVKFVSIGEDGSKEQSKGDVAGNRVYDNLIDFSMWLSAFHEDIRMA